MTDAEQFRLDNEEHFFADAHELIELMASRVAVEVAHNVFLFKDGSALEIVTSQSFVATITPSRFSSL